LSTNLILPPMATLNDAAAELVAAAGEDRAAANAINKAIFYLGEGVVVRPTTGGFLIPSGTRAGTIHRISTAYGCGCEAGSKGKPCWHAALIAIVEQAQTRALPMVDRIAAARRVAQEKAAREMAELFA